MSWVPALRFTTPLCGAVHRVRDTNQTRLLYFGVSANAANIRAQERMPL